MRKAPSQLKWAAKLAIAGALLTLIFSHVPIGMVVAQFNAAKPAPLLGALLATFLARLVSAVQFKCLTDSQKMNVSLARIFYINTVTAFYQLFLPGYISGGAIRWYRLADGAHNADRALSTIVVSRLCDSIVACIWMATMFVVDSSLRLVELSVALKLLAGACVATFFSFLCIRYAQGMGMSLRSRVKRDTFEGSGRIVRFIHWLAKLMMNFSGLDTARLLTTTFLLSLYHLLGALAWYYLAMGLGIQIPLIAVLWIRIVVYFALILPVSFSGLGVREGLLIALLSPFGVDASSAVAFSLLLLSLSITIGICGGLVEAVALTFGRLRGRIDRPSA